MSKKKLLELDCHSRRYKKIPFPNKLQTSQFKRLAQSAEIQS